MRENPELRFDEYNYTLVGLSYERYQGRSRVHQVHQVWIGMDQKEFLLHFHSAHTVLNLCESIAGMTRKLCLSRNSIHDESLQAILASKLIPLDKSPGLRPIGVGEVLRRIIGRAVMITCRGDIVESAGDLQLCAGQQGCKAQIHAVSDVFDDE